MFSKHASIAVCLLTLFFCSIALGLPSASHADWAMNCKCKQMNMNGATGNVIIQATCSGVNGRVSVAGTDPGANKMIAAILTSIALKTTVNFDLFGTFDNSGQVVKGVQLSNPN